MGLSITNNISSLQAQHNLTRTSSSLSKSLERLSSGLKINRGADGPAALVISEQQRAQIAGLQAAIDNASKAVALVQTGEGALNEINSLLVKIRSLALDSANAGVNDANSLAANQAEVKNALDTITRIAQNTQFGKKKLLDGSAGFNAVSSATALTGLNATSSTSVGTFTIANVDQNGQKGQVDVSLHANAANRLNHTYNLGADETLLFNGTVQVQLKQGMTNTQVRDAINNVTSQTNVVASLSSAGNLILTAKNFGGNFTVVSDKADAANLTGIGTTTINTNIVPAGLVSLRGQNLIVDLTGPGGATLNNVAASGNIVNATSGVFNGLSFTAKASAGNAAITDAAIAGATITVSDGTLVFQIGANAGQTAKLSISKATTDALGLNQPNNQLANLSVIDVTTTTGAQDALAVIDKAIEDITNLRGKLGAFQQQTLESTANNLRTTLENTVAAESIIRDTDFAAETAMFTKTQVLVQAGTTVLANANSLSQLVLGLLGR